MLWKCLKNITLSDALPKIEEFGIDDSKMMIVIGKVEHF